MLKGDEICVCYALYPAFLLLKDFFYNLFSENDSNRCVESPLHWTISGWWQLKYFVFFTPKIGEGSHCDEHIFQRGWFNHQPVYLYLPWKKERMNQ